MRFRNTTRWTNLNNMKGLLFFVQRLDELTFPYSLDSYKSPTTSLQGLFYEAIQELKGAAVIEKRFASAEHIVNEIKLRIKGNWVAKSISSSNICDLLNIDKENIDDSVRRLEVIAAELNVEAYTKSLKG